MASFSYHLLKVNAQILVKGLDLWDAAKYGLSDISWVFHGYYPGMTPLADVMNLPGLPARHGFQSATVLWQLFDAFPEMKQSFEKDNKILAFFSNPYDAVATTPRAKPVKVMADFKGLKLRVYSGLSGEWLSRLGGVPVFMPAPDMYLALQKGTIDGVQFAPGFATFFRIDEVLLDYSRVVIGPNYFSMAMNWDTWNKMPADIKAAWEKEGLIGLRATRERIGGWTKGFDNTFWSGEWLTKMGSKYVFYDIPVDEADRWREVGSKPLWVKWVAEMEAKGLPGQKVLDATLRLLGEYKE